MSGQPDCASTCNQTVSLLACARPVDAPAVVATTANATARAAATTTRTLMQVSSSRRRPSRCGLLGRRLVYTRWPRRDIGTPDQPCQPRMVSALRAVQLGHDPVAVAPVDRVHELDGGGVLVGARPPE